MGEIHWIDAGRGRVAVLAMPHPERVEADAAEWESKGADRVVSMLTPEEMRELGLGGEREAVEAAGMEFVSFPVPDGGVPSSMSDARALIDDLLRRLEAGESIGFHCRAGLGRSPMMAAALLTATGVPLGRALKLIAVARGWPVPETEEQLAWLYDFVK